MIDTPDWIFSLDEPELPEVLDRAVRRFRAVNAALLERRGTTRGSRGWGRP